MFEISIIKTQGVYLAFGMGLFVMALMILLYIEIWRPREQDMQPEPGLIGLFKWWFLAIPWFVTVTMTSLFLVAVAYSIYRIIHPPNW